MRTTITFFFILFYLTLSSCTQTKKGTNNFTLQGNINGQATGNIVLQYGFGSFYHRDTAEIKNGNFSFTGFIEEPTRAVLIGGDKLNTITVYLEPGAMKATLSKDNFKDIKLTGSESQKELKNIDELLESANNNDSVLVNFVLKNPKSYLSPFYLQLIGRDQVISLDSLKVIFNGLNLNIQNSRYGRMVRGFIRQNENILEGAFVSDFNANDINNQKVTLSHFKDNNVVLLDFWASWCVPCRRSFPHLKALYKKYHPKGLEIIAIATFDRSRESWLSAIKEDSINMWHHVASVFRDGETLNEDLAFDFPIAPIPRTILIDKTGKVVGSWVGDYQDNEDSLDNKLEEMFKD